MTIYGDKTPMLVRAFNNLLDVTAVEFVTGFYAFLICVVGSILIVVMVVPK